MTKLWRVHLLPFKHAASIQVQCCPWKHSPRCAWPAGEDWAEGTASWAAVLGAVVAGLPAVSPSAEAGLLQSLEMVVTAAPGALVVQAEEMGAAAADEGCDEASVVSLVSKGPGFGGRCLNDSDITFTTNQHFKPNYKPKSPVNQLSIQLFIA